MPMTAIPDEILAVILFKIAYAISFIRVGATTSTVQEVGHLWTQGRCSDVKRGQKLEAEIEAEARALRPRPRPRPGF